jgi:hypothetical protein
MEAYFYSNIVLVSCNKYVQNSEQNFSPMDLEVKEKWGKDSKNNCLKYIFLSDNLTDKERQC